MRLITPSDTRAEEARVRALFKKAHPEHRPWTGAVQINFTAVFQTPKSFNKALKEAAARGELYCTSKPDKDNIEKLIVDALNGVAWRDDCQVMGGGIKRYGSPARVDVSFKSLASPDVPPTPGQVRAERAQQPALPMIAPQRPQKNPTEAKSTGAEKQPPDLSGWSPRQRDLIERALARDAIAQVERSKAR